MATVATEGGHYYARDGAPRYTVPNKSKPGDMRATTLRDARKEGWLPSVTGIMNLAAKPQLERWKQEQILLAALTLPQIAGETVEEFAYRIREDSSEQARVARETGTAIHGSLECSFQGRPYNAEHKPIVAAVIGALTDRFGAQNWQAERSFGHSVGYGGKVDLWSPEVVVDYKVKERLSKKMAYDEHAMQLSAYRHGLCLPNARIANLFVSWDGEVSIHEWDNEDENDRYWGMFRDLLSYWKKAKRYNPSFIPEYENDPIGTAESDSAEN